MAGKGGAEIAGRRMEQAADEGISVRRARIEGILDSMRVKLREIDALRKDLASEQTGTISARQSLQMLQEIKVPSLEVLRDDKKRR